MNAKDEGQQCEHEWNWDRSRCFKCLLELSDYLNALQQQVTELARERDMLLAVVRFAVLQPSAAHSICVSGQNDYYALTSPSTIAQEEQR